MALLGSLQVRMGLDAADFRRNFGGFQKDLKRGVGKFQRSMRGLTSVGSLGGGLAAGLGLKSLIQTAGDFEGSMNGVRAVMSDLSSGEFTKLREKAKSLGKTTQFSAVQSAGAIEVLAKNGLKVQDIMGGALDASLLLAASTGSEIPEAADLATDAMLIFGKSASDLGNVVDRINGVMINSKFNFEDYKNALAAGGPAAVKAGKSMEEFNATIGATASFFASGETAGTAFKVFTDRLVSDTGAAKEAQEKLGISFFDTEGRMKSMMEIAAGLQKGLAGLSDEDAISSLTDQFGTRGANFAVALARAGSAGIEAQKGLQANANAAKQAEVRMSGMAGEAKRAASAFEGLKLQIAEGGLLTAVTSLLQGATSLVNWLGKLPSPVLNAGVAIVALVAAAGPLAFGLTTIAGLIPIITGAVGSMGAGLIALTGPVGIVVAAIVGAGILIYKNWDTVKTAVMGAINGIIGFFRNWARENSALLSGIAAKVLAFKDSVVRVWNALVPIVSAKVTEMVASLNSMLEPIGGLGGAWEILKTTVGTVLTVMVDRLGTAFEIAGVIFNNLADVLTGQKTLWEGFRDAVAGSLKAIHGLILRTFTEVIDWLKTLPKQMVSIGKDIIMGLAAGIRDVAFAPVNAIRDAGTGLIEGAKSLLGIRSPSRVFKKIGNQVMQGLGIGIASKKSLATDAMNETTKALVKAGEDGAGMAGAGELLKISRGEVNETENVFDGVFNNFDDRLSQSIGQGKEGFAALGDSLIAEVGRRALKQVTGDILGGIGGLFGGGKSSGGGFLSSIFGGIGSLFGIPSFAGGGHTGTGARTGGLDGQGGYLAMVHPRETIIDETKMSRTTRAASGGGGVQVVNNFTIAPGVTREELNIAMEEAERQRQREERRRYQIGDPSTAALEY